MSPLSVGPTALQVDPFHFARCAALGLPPALVKLPPAKRTPGSSEFSAYTAPSSDGTPALPPVPTCDQAPASGGLATAGGADGVVVVGGVFVGVVFVGVVPAGVVVVVVGTATPTGMHCLSSF